MQRRSWIKNTGGLLMGAALPFTHKEELFPADGSRPVLRIAHLTDVHLKDKWDAPARFRHCLRHVQSQQPKPDLILNGGDIVFDMNKEDPATIRGLWELWHSTLKAECSLPMHYALGNHDIWWNEADRGLALYGKKTAMEQLQLASPYYSFTKAGWKFIILDSVHLDIDNTWYIGKLGDEQMSWLAQELAATPAQMPVLVLSHIPILTATLMVEDNIVNKWTMLGGDMHTDTAKIIDLFYRYPNVKLCLSGHVHLRDKVEYNGVTFICNGAVSGAWWEGNKRQTPAGYGLIDLYGDGRFEERYVPYS